MTLDEFFAGHEDSLPIFEALRSAIDDLGPVEIRVTKSQVAFCREKVFAGAWTPDRYLHGKQAPLVLTLGFRYRDASPRWKEIVEPARGRFIHHFETPVHVVKPRRPRATRSFASSLPPLDTAVNHHLTPPVALR